MAVHLPSLEHPIGSVDLEEWLRDQDHTASLAQFSYEEDFGLTDAQRPDQELGAPALLALTSQNGRAQLRRALARLSEIERQTVVLRYCRASGKEPELR
jgi:hypothetical protein